MDLGVTVQAACPVCGTAIVPTLARCCERCDTPHHNDCWDYAGGCAIFGCARECGTHSRESSLSSSSPSSSSSSSSPPASPTFHRWFWLYRLHAQGLTVLGLCSAFWVVWQMLYVTIRELSGIGGIDTRAGEIFFIAGHAVAAVLALLALGGGVMTALTLLPDYILRHRAEDALDAGLVAPKGGVRPVLDRLDEGPVIYALRRLLLPVARGMARLSQVLFVIGLAPYIALLASTLTGIDVLPRYLFLELTHYALEMAVVGALTLWPLNEALYATSWVESLQHRVAASFKGGKAATPGVTTDPVTR